MKIKINKLYEEVPTPTRSHYNDAGLDCYCLKEISIPNGESKIVPLGFGLEIPNGYMGVIKPRSSLNLKGIITQIGTIDSGYTGEIKAVFINLSGTEYRMNLGDKICQIVIEPVIICDLVDNFTEERGSNGFGSSGK